MAGRFKRGQLCRSHRWLGRVSPAVSLLHDQHRKDGRLGFAQLAPRHLFPVLRPREFGGRPAFGLDQPRVGFAIAVSIRTGRYLRRFRKRLEAEDVPVVKRPEGLQGGGVIMPEPYGDGERAGIGWQISQVVVARIPVAIEINDPVPADIDRESNVSGQVRYLPAARGGKFVASTNQTDERIEIQPSAASPAVAGGVGKQDQAGSPSANMRIDFSARTVSGCPARIGLVTADTGRGSTGMGCPERDADGGVARQGKSVEGAEGQSDRRGCRQQRRRPVSLSGME